MRAHELMTRDPAVATTNTSAKEVARLMDDHDCGCVPVIDAEDGRKLVGVVTDRDLALRGIGMGKGPDTAVKELMTRDVASVREDADVSEVERLMSDRQIRRVVVANADGCCIGIVSQADLARLSGDGDVSSDDVAGVVQDISAAPSGERQSRSGNAVPRRGSEGSAARYGSAGGGGAEFEPGPERD